MKEGRVNERREVERRDDDRREGECYKSELLHVFTLTIVNFSLHNHMFVQKVLCLLGLH